MYTSNTHGLRKGQRQFAATSAAAVLNFVAALWWREVSIERFGAAIDYRADYIGPSSAEQYRNAYVILVLAGVLAIISIVRLKRSRLPQWRFPLVLSLVAILIVIMP